MLKRDSKPYFSGKSSKYLKNNHIIRRSDNVVYYGFWVGKKNRPVDIFLFCSALLLFSKVFVFLLCDVMIFRNLMWCFFLLLGSLFFCLLAYFLTVTWLCKFLWLRISSWLSFLDKLEALLQLTFKYNTKINKVNRGIPN